MHRIVFCKLPGPSRPRGVDTPPICAIDVFLLPYLFLSNPSRECRSRPPPSSTPRPSFLGRALSESGTLVPLPTAATVCAMRLRRPSPSRGKNRRGSRTRDRDRLTRLEAFDNKTSFRSRTTYFPGGATSRLSTPRASLCLPARCADGV